MKLFVIFIVILVIGAGAGLLLMDGPDGESLLSADDFKPGMPNMGSAAAGQPTKVYKWQDEDGGWHFSSEPVAGAEVMELDGDINSIPAVKAARETKRLAAGAAALPAGITTIAPDKVAELIGAAGALQGSVDSRKAEIEKMLNQERR
jgi:hypothetical protein